MLVEPHRSSTLAVRAPKAWATYSWRIGTSTKASLSLAELSADVDAFEDKEKVRMPAAVMACEHTSCMGATRCAPLPIAPHARPFCVDECSFPPQVSVTRTETGVYSLELTESVKGVVTRTTMLNVYCKYVRRELRELTASDRSAYLEAASTLWRVSTKKGRSAHGFSDRYRSINSLAVIHNDLAGNAVCDHLHGTSG